VAEDSERDVEETVATATLPVIPPELGIDPLLAALLNCAAFLDLSEDEVDEAASTAVLEHVGLYVQRLSPEELEDVADQLAEIKEHGEKAGWPPSVLEFVEDFLYSCGIGEDVSE
jgi:hypothetical protein